MRETKNTSLVQLKLSNGMIEGLDIAIEMGLGNNRTDIIKSAIVDFFIKTTVVSELKKRKIDDLSSK